MENVGEHRRKGRKLRAFHLHLLDRENEVSKGGKTQGGRGGDIRSDMNWCLPNGKRPASTRGEV